MGSIILSFYSSIGYNDCVNYAKRLKCKCATRMGQIDPIMLSVMRKLKNQTNENLFSITTFSQRNEL